MLRHVLPNTVSPILVAATLDLGTIVLTTAGLSFIGMGAKPTDPEWGMLISIGYTKMVTSGHWLGVLVLLVLLPLPLLARLPSGALRLPRPRLEHAPVDLGSVARPEPG